MNRFILLTALVSAIILGGCSGGGDVSASSAEASYKEQEKKAEALAKKNGETPTTEPADQ